jgi:hypothetical protein
MCRLESGVGVSRAMSLVPLRWRWNSWGLTWREIGSRVSLYDPNTYYSIYTAVLTSRVQTPHTASPFVSLSCPLPTHHSPQNITPDHIEPTRTQTWPHTLTQPPTHKYSPSITPFAWICPNLTITPRFWLKTTPGLSKRAIQMSAWRLWVSLERSPLMQTVVLEDWFPIFASVTFDQIFG